MKKFMTLQIVPGLLVCFILFSVNAHAAKKDKFDLDMESSDSSVKSMDIGISAGLWLAGSAEVWTDDWNTTVDKSTSLMLRGILDKNIAESLAMGLYINFSQIKAEDADVDGIMKEFGFAVKPKFLINPTLAVKPGLNIGYRQITSSDIETINAMGLNFSCEFQFLRSESPSFYIDFGFLAQPIGGNSDWHFTFGPIFYLLAGVLF